MFFLKTKTNGWWGLHNILVSDITNNRIYINPARGNAIYR